MDQIVLNTSQLKKQKDTLNSRKNYYAGKISTFQGSKYNATSTLSSLLSKIRTNYTTIGTNIKNVSEYLEDYYKDAEGIEYKFNHSGGSIQTSSVNSIANEYYDVIEKYEFPTQDYFNLSFADSITSAVNNLFTFRKVVETDSVDFVMEDSLYNDVLDIYTEQIDMSIEEYEMIAKEIEKEIDSFSSLESLISMGAAVGAVSAADYNTQLKEALEKSGFSSLEEYKKYINELKSNLSMCEEAVRQLELSKITGKYDCLLFAENFQNYSYQGEISEENIRKLSGTMNEYSPLSFDYDKVYEKYEDVSLMAYVATLSKMYDESTIKAYATDEVWNAYELLEASNISQVSAGSSDCLVGSNLVNAYNYLFENYGREEASQYLTDIEDRVNQILGQNEAMKKLANLSSKDDIFSAIGNEVYVAGTGVGDGLQSWWENMGHAFSAVFSFFTGDTEESRAMTKEEYEAQFFMQGLQQGNYSGPFLINNYEISQGIGNMLPSIIITRGLGAAGVAASTASTAGSAMIGVSSFGGSYHSSMVEGYSQEQALTYGLISGSSEALFEKFLGGVLSDVRVVDGKSYLYSMAKEATEEGLQNVFDAGVRNVLFGDVQTGDELVESTLKSMLYGGITAGILNSPSAISNSVKSAKVSHAIQNGSLDFTNVVTSLKNSGLDIDFDGKTDTQIISENADIVYDMFKEKMSDVDNAIDSFNSQISNMNEEARTDNYNITKEKNSLDFKQYINNYLQKVSNFKFSDINFSERLKNLGDSIYSYFSGNYEIGTSDMTFENLDFQAELISDTLSYSDVDQLKNLLDSGQEGDLAKVLVDGTLTASLDQNISNKALENFNRSSETLIKFFKTTLKNIKNANQIFANMLAKVTKLDSVESDNLNGNLLGKFVGTFGYEFLSGTLMNKRKFTSVTNSKIMLDTIQNEGILHFTSPSTANKIMESGMIKKSGILTSDMTSPKSFFFGGTPTFEDLLINVPAYDVMTAVKIHPTAEQISDLKYRPLNDRAVVYDGDFHFDPEQAEIVYYGLAYDKENNNIFLKQITKEEAQNYHVSEEVKAAYNYNLKKNSLLDEIKMNIYGLYAEYKHHQRLQQYVAQWEQKGLKLSEISDQELYDLWNIKEASVLNKQSINVLNDFINKSDVSSESSASTQDIRIDEIISDSSEYFDRFINDPVNEDIVQDLIDVKDKVLSLKTKENLLEYIDNEATPFALNLLTFNIFNNPLLETLLSNKTVQSFLNRNYSKIELINKYAYMQYPRHEFVIDTFLSLTATDLDSLDFIDLYNVVNSFSEEVQAKFLQKNPNIFDSKLDSLDEESLSAFVFGDFLNYLSFNSQTKLVDSYPNYFNKKFDEFVSSKNYSNEIKRYIIKNCGNYQLFKDLNFSLKYLDSDTQIVFFEKCKSSLYNDSLKCFMEYAGYINDPKYQEKFVKESPFFEEIHTSSGLSSFCSNIKSTDLLVELLYNPKSQSEIISNYSIFKEIMNKLNLSIDEQKKFLEPVKQEIIKKRNKIYYRVDNGYLFQYIDSFSPEVQQILLHDEDFLNTISVSDKIALNSAYNNVYYNDLLSLLHQPFDMDSARLLFEPEFYQLMDQDMINQAALSLRPSDYSRLAQLNNVEAIDTVINRMIGTNYKGISKTQLIPILEIANSFQKQNIMNSIPFSLLLEINSNCKSEELTNLMIQKISLDNEQLTKSDYANLTYLKQDVYLKIYPYLDDKAKLCSYDKHNVNSEIQKEVLEIFRKSPDLINLMSSSSLGNFYDSLSLSEDIDLFYQNLSLTTLSFANKILVSHFDLAKFKDVLINKISDFKTNKSSEVNFQYLNLFSVNDQIDIINSMSKVYQYFILLDGQLQNQEVIMYVLNNMMNDSDFRSYIGKVSNFSTFLDNLSVDNSKYILENANDKFLGFLFVLSKRSDIQLKFQEKLHDNPVLLGEYKLEDAEVMYEKLAVHSKTQLNETLDQMLDSIHNPSVNEIFKDATTAQKSAFLKAYNEGLIDSEKISFLLELKKQNQFVLGTFNYELFDSEIYQLNSALLAKLSKYYEVVGLISRIKNDSVKFNLFNNLMQLNSDLSLVVSDQKMSIILSYLSDRSFTVGLVPKTQEELEVFQNILLKQYDLFALVTGYGQRVIHRDRSLIEPEGYTYSNYYAKLNEQCDTLMNSVQDITEAQNILFNKYFSMSVEDAQELYRIYGSHFSDITNLDENGIATVYLENLVNIFEASSLEEVKDIYYHFDSFYTMEENLIIMDEIRKIYTKSLKNTLFNPVNISDFVEYDGNLVPIYEVSDEFQMLIQSTATSYGGMPMINNNYFDSWNLSSRTSNHGICCSLISNSNMGMASVSGNGIVIGFNSFTDNQINMMAPYDLYTYNDQYNIRSARPMLFLPGDEVINQTRHTHNEFNLERANLEENSKYANIQPDYVVWFEDMDETLKNNAFKASLEFGIPLVYVNKEKIAKMECQKIDQYISDYQTTGNLENILQALLLHENNRSGYRISNQELISQYFPTEKIDTLFRTAISNSNTLEQLEFIKQILLNEQQKFDITYEATDRINVIDLPIEEYIQLLDDKISSL